MYPLKKLEREKKMLNSRFDFMGIDQDNKRFILEVKSVPLCQDEDAFFPDGYRKKKTDIISPRALKHIQELQQIKEMHPDYRTILCFVVQRSDATSFRISDNDPIYKDAVKEAQSKRRGNHSSTNHLESLRTSYVGGMVAFGTTIIIY